MFWKKAAYIAVSVLLVFTLLSLCSYRGDTLQAVSEKAVTELQANGYTAEPVEGGIRYTPSEGEPLLVLPMQAGSERFDLLRLTLCEPIGKGTPISMYFTYDGNYTEENKVTGAISADRKSVYFIAEGLDNCTEVRLQIGGAVTVSSVSLDAYSGNTPSLQFNWLGMPILAVTVAVLCLTERKFAYFAWLRTSVTRPISEWRRLMQTQRKALAVLYAAAWGITLLSFLGIAVLIFFGIYTNITILTAFFITVAAIILQLAVRILSGSGMEAPTLFLLIAILIGVMFCYTMPPSSWVAWDDETHFRNAYDWTHLFGVRPYSQRELLTFSLFPEVNEAGETVLVTYSESYSSNPMRLIHALTQNEGLTESYTAWVRNPYTAFGYLPMIATIGLLSLIGADIVKTVILCRIANLIVFACLIFFGIRKLKSGAYLFSAVCLMPSVLFLACSNNYDFWITAWFAYGFAYLISEFQQTDKKLGRLDLIKILLAFFLACGPKALYCAMLLPLFFLKKSKFESAKHAKRFRIWVAATIGVILATLVVPALFAPDMYTDNRGGSDVSSGGQIANILSNPFRYAGVLLKFLSEYMSFPNFGRWSTSYAYLGGMVNASTGNTHLIFGSVAAFMLLYCTFTDRRHDDAYHTMQGLRWITLLTCFIQISLVATSMYVGFTPVGNPTINGCQFRYLFPLLIPICFFLAPKGIHTEIKPKWQNLFVFGALAVNILASFYVVYIHQFW